MTARWTRPTRSTPGRRLGTYRSTVSGTIPVLLLWVPWAAVVWCLILFWPFGLLMMLPVRIGVRRGTGQYGALWALCFFSMATFGITWIIAAIMAMRDPRPALMPQPVMPQQSLPVQEPLPQLALVAAWARLSGLSSRS